MFLFPVESGTFGVKVGVYEDCVEDVRLDPELEVACVLVTELCAELCVVADVPLFELDVEVDDTDLLVVRLGIEWARFLSE